jgi:hypothetical protein
MREQQLPAGLPLLLLLLPLAAGNRIVELCTCSSGDGRL